MEKSMFRPLVSICIPTYNGEKFISQAMESAINQTYEPLEIIISDDDSSDSTLDIVKSFITKTNIPIKIINHQPSSIGANWNACIENTNGEYIKFLFQDDLLRSDCIELMIELIESDQEIGFIFCKRNLIVEADYDQYAKWISQFGDLPKNWTKIEKIQHGKALLKDINFLTPPRNKIGEPTTVLLSKALFNKTGHFNTELKQALDYEFWYRAFKFTKVGYIDKELATFRLHEEQASAQNEKVPIADYQLYPELVYKNLFFYLHPKIRKELFVHYNIFGRVLQKLIS